MGSTVRYPKDQKAKAREALLKAGAPSLKYNGFNGIGVDSLAAAAGVTSGAFYSNFRNKEAMLEAVIEAGLGEPFLSDTNSASVLEGRARLISFLEEYISSEHSAGAEEGCVMPALSADVSRAQPHVKDTYQRKMLALVGRIAELLDGSESDRARRAWSIVALMVGSITISRGMADLSVQRAAPLVAAFATAKTLIDANGDHTRRPGRVTD
jgi:AcrR family transcriptional regulator